MRRVQHTHSAPRESGVGVIETMLVIGLLVATSAVLLPLLTRSYDTARSESSSDAVRDALREARSRSRGNVGGVSHGVYIDTAASPVTLTLYRGATFISRNSTFDQIEMLEAGAAVLMTPPVSDMHFSGSVGTTTDRTIAVTTGGETQILELLSTGFVRYAP